MPRFTPKVLGPQAPSTQTGAINQNFSDVSNILDELLDRTGTSPNTMSADLVMYCRRIVNLPKSNSDTEPLRLREFNVFQESINGNLSLLSDTGVKHWQWVTTDLESSIILDGYFTDSRLNIGDLIDVVIVDFINLLNRTTSRGFQLIVTGI